MSSEGIEYPIYVKGEPPDSLDDVELIAKERVFNGWWKLVVKVARKEDLPKVAKKLKEIGLRVADSPFLREYFYI